ncbi:VOC family protein [soil metagenome]
MNVIPFLTYEDARAALDWLTEAFGFERTQVHEGEDGTIVHAEMRFADGMIMLGSAGENNLGMKTARELGAVNEGVYSIVDHGLDAHYEQAVAAGAEIVLPLHDTDYGSREYVVRDPEGNLWSFGTYRPELPAE